MCITAVKFCFVYFCQGTNVASGKARGVVIGTGQNTEIGFYLDCTVEQSDYILKSIVYRTEIPQQD